jgi:hypothetical protein
MFNLLPHSSYEDNCCGTGCRATSCSVVVPLYSFSMYSAPNSVLPEEFIV